MVQDCVKLKDSLHERSDEIVPSYAKVLTAYQENVAVKEQEPEGGLAKYLDKVVTQVEVLLEMISSCRRVDLLANLNALKNQLKYYYSRDLYRYSRLMPVHIGQMLEIKENDPETWKALETDFVVAKTDIPFVNLFDDQGLEQEIKAIKRHGGAKGATRDEHLLDKLVITAPYLAEMTREFLSRYPRHKTHYSRKEHYQLTGGMSVRVFNNAIKLAKAITAHCEGNPYTLKTPLKNITSSKLVPESMHDDFLNFDVKGQAAAEEFVKLRLSPGSKISFWAPMKKLKLKCFANYLAKRLIKVDGKLIKYKEERLLLARYLIMLRYRYVSIRLNPRSY